MGAQLLDCGPDKTTIAGMFGCESSLDGFHVGRWVNVLVLLLAAIGRVLAAREIAQSESVHSRPSHFTFDPERVVASKDIEESHLAPSTYAAHG